MSTWNSARVVRTVNILLFLQCAVWCLGSASIAALVRDLLSFTPSHHHPGDGVLAAGSRPRPGDIFTRGIFDESDVSKPVPGTEALLCRVPL